MSVVSLLLGQPIKGTRITRYLNKSGIESAIILDATLKEGISAPSELTQHPVEIGPDVSDHVILRPKTLTIEGVITETPFSIRGQIAGIASTVASQVGQKLGGALGKVPGIGGPGNASAIGGAALTLGVSQTLAGVLAPPSITRDTVVDPEGQFRRVNNLPGENVRLRDAVAEFMAIRDDRAPINIVTGLSVYRDYVMVGFEAVREVTIGKTLRVQLTFQEVTFATIGESIVFLPAIKQGLQKINTGKKNVQPVTPEKEQGSSILYDLVN